LYIGVAVALQIVVLQGALLERRALDDAALYLEMLVALAAAVIAARWLVSTAADTEAPVVQFEETEMPVIQGLGLFRDGVMPEDGL
jgi:hypothetical protein